MRLTSAATDSMRCSQLSSTSRQWRGRSISVIASSIELLPANVDVDRGRERGRRRLFVDDADQLDDVDSVRVVRGGRARQLQTDRGLADTTRPDEGDKTMGRERVDEERHERLTTDQRLDRGSKPGDRRQRVTRRSDRTG